MSDLCQQVDEVHEYAYSLILSAPVYSGLAFLVPWDYILMPVFMVCLAGLGGGLQVAWFVFGYRLKGKVSAAIREDPLVEEGVWRAYRKIKRGLVYLASSFISVQGVIVASLVEAGTKREWVLPLVVLWVLLGVVCGGPRFLDHDDR